MTRPWCSARSGLAERQGWLVRIDADGSSGFGDCAPMPEAGTETFAAAAEALEGWRGKLADLTLGGALGLGWLGATPTPAADLGVECALIDLASRLMGLPMRRLLAADATDRVPVNGMLGPALTTTDADLLDAAAQGFGVLKLKLGIGPAPEELARIESLAALLPKGVRLRLDANGAWDPATAELMVMASNGLPVESLEEPLARPDWPSLARLQSLARFPIALDESLPGFVKPGSGQHLAWMKRSEIRVSRSEPRRDTPTARLPVRRAVLKPGVVGGIARTIALAERLSAGGSEIAVTGIVESASGLWATAQLAAALGGEIPHGLATARWLAEDLGAPPLPEAGSIALPELAGSGFFPKETGEPRVR